MKKILGLLLVTAMMTGCSGDDDALSYDEFKTHAYQEPDTGVFILNGDEIAVDDAALRTAYEGYLASYAAAADRAAGLATVEQPSIVNTVGGVDDRWPQATASNLTYCISQSAFGSDYSAVVNAMNSAAGAWEATANVNFVHVASLDGGNTCNSRNKNIVFNVARVCTGQYLARAFFPSTGRKQREIKIDCTSFGNISPWSLTGVLRHELGHTIGLRHEHTRPESGTCFENTQWRALTAYDSSSVMHYPQCNGTQNGDLVLTNLDKAGASALYP